MTKPPKSIRTIGIEAGLSGESLEGFERAANDYIETAKRWKDELARYQRPLAEDYCSGKVALFYNLQPLASGVSEDQRLVVEDDSLLDPKPFPLLVFNQKTAEFPHLLALNQRPMFVLDVESVKSPDGVPVPSLVRLYYVQESICETDKGVVLRSTFDERYKIFIGAHCREILPLRLGAISSSNLEPSKIERTSQIVDGISRNESKTIGNGLSSRDLQEVVIRLKITLDGNLINNAIEESSSLRVKIADVLVGPFNL